MPRKSRGKSVKGVAAKSGIPPKDEGAEKGSYHGQTDSDTEPEKTWEVESIYSHVFTEDGPVQRVHWKDWAKKYDTWEPVCNLTPAAMKVKDYWARHYSKDNLEQLEADCPVGKDSISASTRDPALYRTIDNCCYRFTAKQRALISIADGKHPGQYLLKFPRAKRVKSRVEHFRLELAQQEVEINEAEKAASPLNPHLKLENKSNFKKLGFTYVAKTFINEEQYGNRVPRTVEFFDCIGTCKRVVLGHLKKMLPDGQGCVPKTDASQDEANVYPPLPEAVADMPGTSALFKAAAADALAKGLKDIDFKENSTLSPVKKKTKRVSTSPAPSKGSSRSTTCSCVQDQDVGVLDADQVKSGLVTHPYVKSLLRVDDLPPGSQLRECGAASCPCWGKCDQTVVAKAVRKQVTMFMTMDGDDIWALRTEVPIKKGEYVIDVAGEMISQKEAEERLEKAEHDMNVVSNMFYLGGLGMAEADYPAGPVLDTFRAGNAARVLSHSCNPNVGYYQLQDGGEAARLVLFALRDIEPGEKLTVDRYTFMQYEGEAGNRFVCRCREDNCRVYLY